MMEVVGGIPVECLTAGELAGVWSGWTGMGDREVVRESSAKGTHIDLAYKFLAYRRHWTIAEATKYFYSEVEIWINELLRKQTIHRASHILKNVGKDPIQYISEICINCTEPELRDYLAKHVMSNNGFTEDEIEAWEIINCIKADRKLIKLSNDFPKDQSIQNISIEEMINLSPSVKSPLITELYFHTKESFLTKKLKNNFVWDYLLTEDNVELLVRWIDKKFSNQQSDVNDDDGDTKFELVPIFDRLDINEEMMEKIKQSSASITTKEIVLNHLVKHGVFTKKESQDVRVSLSRFFAAEITPSEFKTILSKDLCNLDVEKFSQNIHSILYYQVEDHVDSSLYTSDKKLLNYLNNLSKPTALFDETILRRCIYQTIYTISDQPDTWLKDNPLIAFYLILSKYSDTLKELKVEKSNIPKPNLQDIMNDENGIVIDDFTIIAKVIAEILDKLPYLKKAIVAASKENDLSMYQLLNGFRNVNIQELFRWRYKKDSLPNFASDCLIKKYGHKEKLTYKYFLKEARPSMAAYVLQNLHDKKKIGLSSKMKSHIVFQAHIFGLKHANKPEIMSTCIAFIEFLRADSEYLRLHATAADYVQNKLNISINDLLESITYQNQKDLVTVITHLEHSFQIESKAASMKNVNKFIAALQSWDFIVRFTRAHNIVLPDCFLRVLATENLWFEFVLVGHIFRYPLEQILQNAEHFENCNIRKHLLICLNNSHLVTYTPSFNSEQYKQREARNSVYSRIITKNNDSPPALQEIRYLEELLQNEQCFPLNQRNFSFDDDLWLTILKCHQSQDPPGALLEASLETKSPILIVLAACYEPSSIAAYCYSWLVISLKNEEIISMYTDCLNDQVWSVRRITELFRNIISLGFVETLSRGFEIFLPDNALCSFSKFLVECIKHGNFENSKKYLWEFLNKCSGLKSNKMIDWEDSETTYLSNEYWITTVAIEMVITALGACFGSTHLQKKFLNILVDDNFNDELNINEPDFCSLLQIITILSKTSTKINFTEIKLSMNGTRIQVTQEVERCIHELVAMENFSNALKLSKIANLPCSSIILNQYRSEFKRHSNYNDHKLDSFFWKKCADDIRKYDVGFEDAAAFFIEHAELVKSYKERYEILKLALETLKSIATDQQTIDMVEMAMWKSCILAGPESILIQSERRQFDKLKTELMSGVSNLRVSCSLNDSTEETAVEALIDKFIDIEDLATALRISAIFNYKHRDLQILMLCLSLAEGETSPYQLNFQHKNLLAECENVKEQKFSTLRNRRGLPKKLSNSSLNLPISISNFDSTDTITSNPIIQQIQMDCTSLLEKLVKKLQHGLNVGQKILLLYKLSLSLKKNYRNLLVSKDPMEMLYEITGINCDHKFDLITDVIAAYQIRNIDVAKFFAGEINLHIIRQIEDDPEDCMTLMWGYPLDVCLHLIPDLCSDTSILGWELLKNASLRLGHSLGVKRDISALKIVVELLVRSHDFFTASCSMEGISSVLRKCQQLANTLQQLKLWSLLVRLVTGVGRFTEMNYIFQILKENDQFEFLLGQGMDKISGLKIALLEFCKRQCSDDKELFKLVALHFRLYNEIAIMWETEAKSVIRELIKETRKDNIRSSSFAQSVIKFVKNMSTEKRLLLSISNFTHATEYYLQGNKLNQANRCSHQAQLCALQMSLLNGAAAQNQQQVACLLNLSADEVNRALCHVLSFPQALILVQAYNHNADWSSAIYHHVILNGETKYLKDFLTTKRLTTAITQDCACRYRMEKNISKQMTINMKSLIVELNDIECKYVLASQLGFKDIIEVILSNSTTGSYLKDTVWKQGFKPQEFIGETFRG